MQPTELQLKVDDDSWLKVGKIKRDFRQHIHVSSQETIQRL